jgi:GTP cyclohydrolase I
MPIKKSEEDIFYSEKKLTHTSHPILVGCDEVFLPLTVKRKDNTVNYSSFNIKLLTELNSHVNGSNINGISDFLFENSIETVEDLIELFKDKFISSFNSKNATLILNFDYFLTKKSPVSSKKSLSKFNSKLEVKKENDNIRYFLTTEVPYSSLCPVSKDISDYGAHNQRCYAEITVELSNFSCKKNVFWIEDIVSVVETSCSCPVYNAGNLQDEAFQTEMMYETPLFIEEISIKIKNNLQKQIDKNINDYCFTLRHKESINSFTFISKTTAGKNLK